MVAASIGASVVGSVITSQSAKSASKSQAASADNATALQGQMFDKTQENLHPFIEGGWNAFNAAQNQAYGTGFEFNPDMATLEKTPGYQFTLGQGLKAAQNSASSRGLGISGQAQAEAEKYATGLASGTFQDQFNNALTAFQTNFGNKLNIANIGENAAAGLGNNAQATGQGMAGTITGAGNARAAGTIAAGNALGNGAANIGNYSMFNQLMGGMYGSGDAGAAIGSMGADAYMGGF